MSYINDTIHRRGFLGLATSTALGVAALSLPVQQLMAQAKKQASPSMDPGLEKWLGRIKGKHKQVFDAPSTNGGLPLAWARVFVMSNMQVGVPEKDITSVLVLRHDAIPFAMNNGLWQKYSFGEAFNVTNMMTKARVATNIFWEPKEELPLPGMSIDQLLKAGVLIGVCDLALTFNSMHVAEKMKMKPEEVKADWVDGIFPGIQIVPSGVLAINRAQEHGCTYCYAGEG